MAIIRTAKGLQEVQDTTLRDRLAQLNAPQVTSAAAAQSLGATPKQQDMAGTQVRKNAVIKENLAPKQDQLSLSDRYAQQSATVSNQQQAQLDDAQKLAKLAGLDTRVQKLAENRINQAGAQPVQRSTNESELSKTIPVTDPRYAQATQALTDYANDPSKQEQALVTLQNLGIAPAQINNLLETTDAALGRAADVTQLKGSDLDADIRDMGYAGGVLELSQQLGKDVGSLSIEDLTKEIQAYRTKVTSEKENLEAQALNQTGMQQQAAMGQLKTFTQAGGVGQEQQVEQALQPIDMASTVKVGDQDMRVDQLLQDQEFSDLIEQWAISSPEEREKLIPSAQFGPLVQWMTQNESSIKQAAQAGQQAQTGFATTQAGVQALGKDVLQDKAALSKLVPGYDPSRAYTAAELADMDTKLKASPVYQFAQSSPEGRTYINSFKPDELDQVAGMSTQQLQQQATTYNKVKASPGLQSRYDLDPNKKVYSPAELQSVENFSNLPGYIQTVGTDPDFKGLTIDQLKYFDKDGQLNKPMVEEFKQFLTEQKAALSDNDAAAVNDVFGGQAASLNSRYADLKSRAEYGDPEAVAALKDFSTMDTDGDGDIDAADARKLAGDRKAALIGKDADYFKEQYGTGANGYQTLSEKNAATGTKVASATGSGIYADPGLQTAMKTGDFSPYINTLYSDEKSYNNLIKLRDTYKNSGMPKTEKYAALNRAIQDMGNKYVAERTKDLQTRLDAGGGPTPQSVKTVMGELDSLRKSTDPRAIGVVSSIESSLRAYTRDLQSKFAGKEGPQSIRAVMDYIDNLRNSSDPKAADTIKKLNGALRSHGETRLKTELGPIVETRDGWAPWASGSAWQAYKAYKGTQSNISGYYNIAIPATEARAYQTFISDKIKADPSYVADFSDPNSRNAKDLAAYMKSNGFG